MIHLISGIQLEWIITAKVLTLCPLTVKQDATLPSTAWTGSPLLLAWDERTDCQPTKNLPKHYLTIVRAELKNHLQGRFLKFVWWSSMDLRQTLFPQKNWISNYHNEGLTFICFTDRKSSVIPTRTRHREELPFRWKPFHQQATLSAPQNIGIPKTPNASWNIAAI